MIFDFIKDILYPAASGDEQKVADADIIAAIDPWMLACAVGTLSRHSDFSSLNFGRWLALSKANWMPEVRQTTGASDSMIESAIMNYAATNRHLDYRDVLRSEAARRGQRAMQVLGPGETMTVHAQRQA